MLIGAISSVTIFRGFIMSRNQFSSWEAINEGDAIVDLSEEELANVSGGWFGLLWRAAKYFFKPRPAY